MYSVFPYQQLDLANFASQPIIMETGKEFVVEWAPRRNLLRNRVSPLAGQPLRSSEDASHSDPCACWCPWREGLRPRTLTGKGLGQSSVKRDAGVDWRHDQMSVEKSRSTGPTLYRAKEL